MRKFMLLISFCAVVLFLKAENISTESSISSVTVYLQGAKINRQASIYVPAGRQQIVVTNLSNLLERESLQVSIPSGSTLLSTTYKVNYLTPNKVSAELQRFQDSTDQLQLKIELTQNLYDALKQEQELLLVNKTIGGSESGLDPANLKEVVEYYRERLPELKNTMTGIKREITALNERLTNFQHQVQVLNSRTNKPSGEITLQVENPMAQEVTITFSYIVQDAGWTPSYDVRVTKIHEPLKIMYKANVYQNTGIDWENVKLSISTGNPASNHTRPVLTPWYINLNSRSYYASDVKKSTQNMAYIYNESNPANGNSFQSIPQTKVLEHQLNVEFKIDSPYDIPSNANRHMVRMKEHELPAIYEYHAVPKLDNHAFLLAKFTDWNKLNLLPGPANIFFENGYIGQTNLNPYIAADTLLLSLGRDQSVVVKKQKLSEFCKKSFIGINTKETVVYEINVRNNKNQAINLEIIDHIPVSQNEDIKVKLEEKSGATYLEKNGKLMWRYQVKPGDTEQMGIEYTVKYPKGKFFGTW